MPVVTWQRDGAVGLVTLDRPPLNILNLQARNELDSCLDEIEMDPGLRAIVLFGAGGRAFSVGSDIGEFEASTEPGKGAERALREHSQCNRIATLPQPVIVAVEGYCLGGGLELALACDLRVAAQQSIFGLPEITLGVFPCGGGTERLPDQVGRSKAKELMFLGEQLSAEEARNLGIVNRVVPSGQALDAATDLARRIAEQPAVAIRAIKQLVDLSFRQSLTNRLQTIARITEEVFQSQDVHEGRAAFLGKRPPRFQHR